MISEKHLRMMSRISLKGGSNTILGSSTLSLIIIICVCTYCSSSNTSPNSLPFCKCKSQTHTHLKTLENKIKNLKIIAGQKSTTKNFHWEKSFEFYFFLSSIVNKICWIKWNWPCGLQRKTGSRPMSWWSCCGVEWTSGQPRRQRTPPLALWSHPHQVEPGAATARSYPKTLWHK